MDRNKVKNFCRSAFNKVRFFRKRHFFLVLFLVYLFFLSPEKGLSPLVSTVVYDRNGELLGARLAADEQWRFPLDTFLSEKVKKCIIIYEDEYYYYHPGINPISVLKSAWTDLKNLSVKRGGSTITMQLCRLMNHEAHRNIGNKLYEMLLAIRVELHFSKREILQRYLSNAPFGGNIIGVEAASWRYFGRSTRNLSWAEAATLAVLPNAPALIHPGRNRNVLLRKRNQLLLKLYQRHILNHSEYETALLEEIPERPSPLPEDASHLTALFAARGEQIVHSTISRGIQLNCQRIAQDYLSVLDVNKIGNTAVLVADVKNGEVLAYLGNTCHPLPGNSPDVDIVQAPRSTGSVIKPLLYALMLQEGDLLPTTLVPDIPTRIAGFNPDNYDNSYRGAIPAKQALSRSLNVPIVRMLQSYGVDKFHSNLKKLGMSSLYPDPDRYGLTLVVGGAEGKLFDLVGIYSNLARVLNQFNQSQKYSAADFRALSLEKKDRVAEGESLHYNILDAGSIYLMFDALLEVNRPEEDVNWKDLSSSRRIGWKTGTSYGFRDGWAIGTTPEYVVGVWVGNANGEGRPGLTGAGAAAPLMFRIFSSLPATSWFDRPADELEKTAVCHESGYKAGVNCEHPDTIYISRKGIKTAICPYHHLMHISQDGKHRVTAGCGDISHSQTLSWFVLPPAMEWYYIKSNSIYRRLPPLEPNCGEDDIAPMEIVFPADVKKIYIPRELDGEIGKLVVEVAHRNPDATLYWHLDDEYLGETRHFHQFAISPGAGWHTLTIVDGAGHTLVRHFEVLEKDQGTGS